MKRLLIVILLTLSFSTLGASLEDNVNKDSVNKVIKELNKERLNLKGESTLTLYLNSNGGGVIEGFRLINKLKEYQSEGLTIKTIVIGYCASMCFTILQTGDIRITYPLTYILQHNVSGGNPYSRVSLQRQMRVMEADRMNVALEIWMKKANPEVTFSSKEALEYGVIDLIGFK